MIRVLWFDGFIENNDGLAIIPVVNYVKDIVRNFFAGSKLNWAALCIPNIELAWSAGSQLTKLE